MRAAIFTGISILAVFAAATGQGPQATGPQLSPETVRLITSVDGADLFKTYCAVCHGANAQGGGPMAASLKVAPADLTKIAARNGGVFPLGKVEKVIAGEESTGAGHGTPAMPIWGPIFSQVAWDQDLGHIRMHNLAVYIEKLQRR